MVQTKAALTSSKSRVSTDLWEFHPELHKKVFENHVIWVWCSRVAVILDSCYSVVICLLASLLTRTAEQKGRKSNSRIIQAKQLQR